MIAAGSMILPRLAQGETPSISLSLPDDRWPGRVVVDGKTLDDFVSLTRKTPSMPMPSRR